MSKKNKKTKIYNPYETQQYIIIDDIQINPDRLFENASVDFEKYMDLHYLDVIAKCDIAAKSFAKKFPSAIEQGESSNEVYEYILGLWDGKIKGLDLKQAQDNILEYILPGFSVTQLIQGLDGDGRKTIVETVTQPQNYFAFTNQGELKPSDAIIGTKPLDTDLEFLVTRDKLTGGNYYGVGVAKSVYYDSQILKDLNKFVHQTSSKSAVPPVVVINKPLGSGQSEASKNAAKTSAAFEKLRSGSAVSVGNVQDIKELKGGDPLKLVDVVRIYESKVCERYIGNADLIQHFNGGSYAKLTELTGIVRIFAEPRNIILESAMNELIERVVRVTFGKDIKAPRLVFDRQEKPDPQLILEYFKEGIPIKTKEMPSFVGEEEDVIQKDLSTNNTNLNLSDNSKKKTFNLTLN